MRRKIDWKNILNVKISEKRYMPRLIKKRWLEIKVIRQRLRDRILLHIWFKRENLKTYITKIKEF